MTGQPPPGFTCPHYVAVPGSKRCKDYQDGGTCARPDIFVCTEWERVNRHRLPLAPRPTPSAPAPSTAPAIHLSAAGLTQAEAERFRALATEVCLFSPDVGEVWIVPAPTGEERTEITVDQLAVIANAVAAFPGSSVVGFRKGPRAPAPGGAS